jgi:chromosome segregation ATPase
MNDNIFPTTEQEAQRAANELSEIKVQLKELLGKLNQIEKRLKAIAPDIQTKKVAKPKQEIKQLFSDEQLQSKYEVLSQKFKTDTTSAMSQLQSLDSDELSALAKHLGCTVSRNPSDKKLVELIVGRLKESKLLSDGFGK